MKLLTLVLSVALLLVMTVSMATEPPAPAASANAITATAPTATAPTATGAPIGPAVVPADDAAAIAKAAHSLGFVQRQRNSKTVYCKADAALGTRLASMTCYTPEEVTAVVQRDIANRDSVAAMQRAHLTEANKN